MKTEPVKVGTKFGTEHFQVECSVQIPESLAEALTLARKSEAFAVQMFVRGWRIWNQEQSGARDFIQGSTVKDRESADFPKKVQAVIDAADPTAPPKRTGRPAAPREVVMTPELSKAMKSGDMAAFAAQLAAQGVKVNIAAK